MKKLVLMFVSTLLMNACAPAPPRPAPWYPHPSMSPALESAPRSQPAPSQKSDGRWRVSLISVQSEPKAERLAQRFSDKGYRVEIEAVEIEGTKWWRVVFPGQVSQSEAKQVLAKLEDEFGIKGGWVPNPRRAEP